MTLKTVSLFGKFIYHISYQIVIFGICYLNFDNITGYYIFFGVNKNVAIHHRASL